jgi:phosphopantetheinyl transferase
MPIYKTLNNRNHTQVYIWKIEESEAWLRSDTPLSKNSINRLITMSSELHRRGFLSIRHLLKAAGYSDHDLFYSDQGKPFLKDDKKISISHSFTFTCIVISDVAVGIDVEMRRDKIQRIAPKFIGFESSYLNDIEQPVRELTIIWGAKESMYKLYGTRGLGFKANCRVNAMDLSHNHTTCSLTYEGDHFIFDAFYEEVEGFTVVYILPINE